MGLKGASGQVLYPGDSTDYVIFCTCQRSQSQADLLPRTLTHPTN